MRPTVSFGRALGVALALMLLATPVLATAPTLPAPARLLFDVGRNKLITADSVDTLRQPASLTKLMTLYLTFEALRDGRLHWNDRLPISANAESMPPFKFAIGVGNSITVREAVEGMIVISANDAAVAVAEHLGGSVPAFAQMMTDTAHRLGMRHTTFRNPTGLSDPKHLTTARDMATLALALMRDFPEHFHFFSQKYIVFRGMKLRGHNFVMNRVPAVNGMKTGYTSASGYSVVTSAEQGDTRLIGVIIGADSARDRDTTMAQMIEAHLPPLPPDAPSDLRLRDMAGNVPLPRPQPLRGEHDTR
ncbi:D-alanyl-D-alanine carboxypeptidase family protein [Breoghania sp.]|uniref:D-alanyl-D-alanine carboxypeptidase family protein n=1 Tax=Breoghania sp. TaxID=2065378 RepID=UPI002AA8CC09|nr:D-alanyl-D-alanine carboxypeptidase family protein [Breoghania sp.]